MIACRHIVIASAFALLVLTGPIRVRGQEEKPRSANVSKDVEPAAGPAGDAAGPAGDIDQKRIVRGNLLAPKAFRAAAAKIRPAVVAIETFGGVAGAGQGKGTGFREIAGQTTGVILSPDGFIVTSTFNFRDKPPVITVILPGGQRKVARLLGRDETCRICLLKIDEVSGLPVAERVDRKELKVGQWVVALGTGYGEAVPSLSAGIISAVQRISGKAVQTDANLGPANYGGPLVDLEGRLVGICVPLSPGSNEATAGAEWYDSGIGFAVPLAVIDSVLEDLKAGKTVRRGYLAVQAKPFGEPPQGTEITDVIAGFAAEKAGIKKGDKLLRFGGEEVFDAVHLQALVPRYYVGDKVPVEVQRGDEQLTMEVTLGEMPPPPDKQPANPLEALKKLLPGQKKPSSPPPQPE